MPESETSVVAFPFKEEDHRVIINNITTAAAHPRVGRVICVGFEVESTYEAVERARPTIETSSGTPVDLVLQERIGSLRPGKGDGMNTALRSFLADPRADRLHFYDADILSFSADWIDKAESAADAGHDAVRHYFPRSSTDAMITWMVTRTGLALVWPESELSFIEQPLGGELLFTRTVVEHLVDDGRVRAQSDWGIDTQYTFATVAGSFSVAETYMPQGKVHRLYGSLTDLRTMLIECFAALQGLRGLAVVGRRPHVVEAPTDVPVAVKRKVAYDVESTIRLLAGGWSPRQDELLALFPAGIRDGMYANRTSPHFAFMDDDAWRATYLVLLDHFDRDDTDWQALLFRLWIARVLQYTMGHALQGYDHAAGHLREMIENYRSGR